MPNILIVDDREDILESYKLGLEDANIGRIFIAKNENEAQKILSENPIDVVITDLVMLNERSGIDVLENAKKKDPFIMVLIVTAFESKLDRFEAFEKGAFDCITRGTLGVKTIDEILFKTNKALKFRELTLKEIDHEKTVSFLKRYFDPKIWEIIKKNQELLNIKKKTVSVVFWDIRGFSKLCEILKEHPPLISEFLRDYFKESSNVIFKHKGILDKFIGDAVMSLFGVFNDDDDWQAAINAIEATIEMQQKFHELKKKWMEEWQLYTAHRILIGLGCGVHTGEVLVGNMGTEERDHFTAVGAHVNFAQRIEHRAEDGQILISTPTKQRIQNKYKSNLIDTWKNIKNIPGEYDIFEIAYRN